MQPPYNILTAAKKQQYDDQWYPEKQAAAAAGTVIFSHGYASSEKLWDRNILQIVIFLILLVSMISF